MKIADVDGALICSASLEAKTSQIAEACRTISIAVRLMPGRWRRCEEMRRAQIAGGLGNATKRM